jgi:hypothetical protein
MAKDSTYRPLYDEDGYTKMCKDCCSNAMKKILKQHNITKLKLKNKADFQELMAITFDFIAYAETAENQEVQNESIGESEDTWSNV